MVYGGVDITNPQVIQILAPGVYECTLDNLRLLYNADTGRHVPIDAVTTRIRGEHLDAEGFDPENDDPITRAFGEFASDIHWGQGGWGLATYLKSIGYTEYVN